MEKEATYQSLLGELNWKEVRETILKRDEYECIMCNNQNIFKNCEIKENTLFNITSYYQVTGSLFPSSYPQPEGNCHRISMNVSNGDSSFYKIYFEFFSNDTTFQNDYFHKNRFDLYYLNIDMKKIPLAIKDPLKGQWIHVKNLHVHHKYYIYDEFPWDYPQDALMTLCHECHYKLHQEETIPVYLDDSLSKNMNLTPCRRCWGAGEFPEYKHVQSGVCFRCKGWRYEEFFEQGS